MTAKKTKTKDGGQPDTDSTKESEWWHSEETDWLPKKDKKSKGRQLDSEACAEGKAELKRGLPHPKLESSRRRNAGVNTIAPYFSLGF